MNVTWKMRPSGSSPADDNANATWGVRFNPAINLASYQALKLAFVFPNDDGSYCQIWVSDHNGIDARVPDERVASMWDLKPGWKQLRLPLDRFSANGTGQKPDWSGIAELKFVWNSASGNSEMSFDEIAFVK